MVNPHAHRLPELVAEAKASAAELISAWDRRALDWPMLDRRSVVVEVGGYKGRWALQIAERYHPRLFVFEPQPWAYATCAQALGSAARVLPYGLGVTSGMLPMGDWETDGASFAKPAAQGSGMLREIGRAFKDLGIKRVDLMLMNIEGYEYQLLPHMLDKGILPHRLMVQMHDFAGDSAALRERLASTYRLLWDYGNMLTAWERD